MVLPSGDDSIFSVWTRNPADGAASSVSQRSMNIANSSRASRAASVLASAISVSRLSTSLSTNGGIAARIALILGSRRGSAAMSSTMLHSLFARNVHDPLCAPQEVDQRTVDLGRVAEVRRVTGARDAHELLTVAQLPEEVLGLLH